ncbi:uncharacterized protein LOC21392937 isoform X2 [Morus notabilis]|uniref:uncharacterized protein LOC21392937 isoform X2 n=1 Tax=Morus notabilis TaxID=981085 RepID=UPI000CED03B6|nr:uncharacterized protein LOC21392937 isoform X2 [Morus notabilis]
MWSSNFVKHLSCTLTSCNFHKLSSFPRFVFFFTKAPKQPTELTKPTSAWFSPNISASLSSLASSETSQTNSYVSPYLSVDIRCHKDVVDMLSEALLCFGANSTSIDEKDTDESSDEICINSIFPEGHDINSCISHAADSIGLKELPRYEVRVGEQYDWIKKTQESFNPVKVAEGLWIVPEWKTPLDLQATNIILNPGLAFGTGEHATTKLCLLLLHGLIKGGEHFLDYGTGSGILAIAALKFGAALSVGTDIDPQAIACARENAALNDIGPEKMHLQLIPETTSPGLRNLCGIPETENLIEVVPETEKFDVVVANILLNPLLDLAGNIVSYAKPGAVVGVSGILSEQVPYIMERYSQFLEGISVSEMDDWACVCGTKKRNVSAAN